jgi:general secretion pathway protein A
MHEHILTTVIRLDESLALLAIEPLYARPLPNLLCRIRVRLALERSTPDELHHCLKQALHKAGAAKLMTEELIAPLCGVALPT